MPCAVRIIVSDCPEQTPPHTFAIPENFRSCQGDFQSSGTDGLSGAQGSISLQKPRMENRYQGGTCRVNLEFFENAAFESNQRERQSQRSCRAFINRHPAQSQDYLRIRPGK
jgi:hypothetical protein